MLTGAFGAAGVPGAGEEEEGGCVDKEVGEEDGEAHEELGGGGFVTSGGEEGEPFWVYEGASRGLGVSWCKGHER